MIGIEGQESVAPNETGMCPHGNFPASCEICNDEEDKEKEDVISKEDRALLAVTGTALWAAYKIGGGGWLPGSEVSKTDEEKIEKQGLGKVLIEKAKKIYGNTGKLNEALKSGNWDEIFREESEESRAQ